MSQQKKFQNRKISKIVSNDLAVQRCNTDLTWEEGYNRLENIRMVRGISKSKLAQLANFIEEETFLNEDITFNNSEVRVDFINSLSNITTEEVRES